MVSAAGYSQLTRQHLIATPFLSPSSRTALLGPFRSFTCNCLIPVTECAVWGSARRARKVADPLHMNLPFFFGRAIVGLDEIEHLQIRLHWKVTAFSGCGSRARSSPSYPVHQPHSDVITLHELKAITVLNHILTL